MCSNALSYVQQTDVGVYVYWSVYLVTTLESQPEHSYRKTLWDNGIGSNL